MQRCIFGVMVLAGLTLAGCTASDLTKLEDPLVINGIATGSYQGCCQAAQRKPDDADIARRVLDGMVPQLEACRQGLTDCMPAEE